MWGRGSKAPPFTISAEDGLYGQLHAAAALPRDRSTQYPSDRILGATHRRSGRYEGEKNLPLLGIEPLRRTRNTSLYRLSKPDSSCWYSRLKRRNLIMNSEFGCKWLNESWTILRNKNRRKIPKFDSARTEKCLNIVQRLLFSNCSSETTV
jgi:hypothetical protein